MSLARIVKIVKAVIIYINLSVLLISWILYTTYLSSYKLNISVTSVRSFLFDIVDFYTLNLTTLILNYFEPLIENFQIFKFKIFNYSYTLTFWFSDFNFYFYLIYFMNYKFNFSLIIQYFSILIIFILILSLSIWTRAAGPRVRTDQLIAITTKTFFLSLILISIIVMILIKIQINK